MYLVKTTQIIFTVAVNGTGQAQHGLTVNRKLTAVKVLSLIFMTVTVYCYQTKQLIPTVTLLVTTSLTMAQPTHQWTLR